MKIFLCVFIACGAWAGSPGKWLPSADLVLPKALSDFTVTEITGFGFFIAGGCDGQQIYSALNGGYGCSSVSSDAWLLSMPGRVWTAVPAMPRPRYRHSAVWLADARRVLLLTGRSLDDNLIAAIDVFNIDTKTWVLSPAQSMPNPVSDAAAFVLGAKVLVVGGYDATYTALKWTQQYDPSTMHWTRLTDMLEARGDLAAVAINGNGFVAGGFTHVNNFSAALNSTEMFSLTKNAWTPAARLNEGRGDKVMAVVDGSVYVVGGETKDATGTSLPVDDMEIFSVSQNTWTPRPEVVSSARFRFAGAAFGSMLFILGGQGALVGTLNALNSYYPLKTVVEEYEVATTKHINAPLAFGLAIGLTCSLILIFGLYKSGLTRSCRSTRRYAADGGIINVPDVTAKNHISVASGAR